MTSVPDVVERYLAERDLRYERVSDGDWAVLLKGEKKLAITVLVALRERTLAVESFFIRRPAENQAELYRMLLRANTRVYGVRFALDDCTTPSTVESSTSTSILAGGSAPALHSRLCWWKCSRASARHWRASRPRR